MIAISAPQRVESSLAFLKSPDLRFEKVTWRLLSFDIFTISTFWRPLLFLAMVKATKVQKKINGTLLFCLAWKCRIYIGVYWLIYSFLFNNRSGCWKSELAVFLIDHHFGGSFINQVNSLLVLEVPENPFTIHIHGIASWILGNFRVTSFLQCMKIYL